MNIRIHSPLDENIPNSSVEIETAPQPFYHTAVRFTGVFGHIEISRADLAFCTIWHVTYLVEQAISLSNIIEGSVYQVCFPLTANANAAGEKVPEGKVYLSRVSDQNLNLPGDNSSVLAIHYAPGYFSHLNKGSNGNLKNMFEQNTSIKLAKHSPIQAVCSQIISVSPSHRIAHVYLEAKVKELLTLIYLELNPEANRKDLTEKQLEAIQKAYSIILTDLSKNYSIMELSRLCGTNMFTLKKDFKTYYGLRIDNFQHNARMEKATELLLNTELSIKEIAFAVGYKAVSNFSESYKNHFGYPPSRVRGES